MSVLIRWWKKPGFLYQPNLANRKDMILNINGGALVIYLFSSSHQEDGGR
jgi:hypothetical protein